MGRARRVTFVFAWLGGASALVAACGSESREFHGAAGAGAGGQGSAQAGAGGQRGGATSAGASGHGATNQAGTAGVSNAGEGGMDAQTGGSTGHTGGTGGTGGGSGGTTSAGGTAGRNGTGGTGLQTAGGAAGMSGQAGEGGSAPECAAGDPPRCKNAATSETCSNGAWQPVACSGNMPTCVEGVGCTPCTEHSQCPASACHLAGPKQGTCFAGSTVVSVGDAASLVSGVTALSSGTERVFRLAAGSYALSNTLTLTNGGEVAFVGVPGTVVSGGPSAGDARNSAFVINSSASSAITYLAGLSFTGTSASSALSAGGVVYLDDLRVSGYYRALAANGEVHVRRSWFASSGLGSYLAGGSLFMQNSAIGPNGYSTEGLQLGASTTIDFRYVTIAGSMNAIDCLSAVPPVGGTVRNSIFASTAGGSVYGGTNGSNCGTIQFAGTVVDQTGFGTEIAWYNDTWFAGAATGDFHLTNVGKSAIPQTASRGSDDPAVDIDGDARKASNGYPGLDEP